MISKIERARQRNWIKARVIGMTAGMDNYESLTPEELNIIYDINNLKDQLLERWEYNSKQLGMKVKERKSKLG